MVTIMDSRYVDKCITTREHILVIALRVSMLSFKADPIFGGILGIKTNAFEISQ